MPKYQVNFDVRMTGQTTVRASSLEEAKEIAGNYDIKTVLTRSVNPKTTIYAFSVAKADDDEETK